MVYMYKLIFQFVLSSYEFPSRTTWSFSCYLVGCVSVAYIKIIIIIIIMIIIIIISLHLIETKRFVVWLFGAPWRRRAASSSSHRGHAPFLPDTNPLTWARSWERTGRSPRSQTGSSASGRGRQPPGWHRNRRQGPGPVGKRFPRLLLCPQPPPSSPALRVGRSLWCRLLMLQSGLGRERGGAGWMNTRQVHRSRVGTDRNTTGKLNQMKMFLSVLHSGRYNHRYKH